MKQPTCELGDEVEDRLTGAKGIVALIAVWLNGCVRVGIQPPMTGKDNGKPPDIVTVDDHNIKVTKKAKITSPVGILLTDTTPTPQERSGRGLLGTRVRTGGSPGSRVGGPESSR